MDALQVPLSSVGNEGLEVDTVVAPEAIRPEGAETPRLGAIKVSGLLTPAGDEVLFSGSVAGKYLGECSRCLEPVEEPFSLEVFWRFVSGSPVHPLEELGDDEWEGEDDAPSIFEGNVIDLGPSVWEEIVVSAPQRILCRDDCAGLCPVCGANRNKATCSCVPESAETKFTNKGLKGLADLFPDLNSNRSED